MTKVLTEGYILSYKAVAVVGVSLTAAGVSQGWPFREAIYIEIYIYIYVYIYGRNQSGRQNTNKGGIFTLYALGFPDHLYFSLALMEITMCFKHLESYYVI